MMHLRKINIRNVRKFISSVQIDGLTAGLNVIRGDNEDGKSTILQAIRAALCTKYSVTGKELQSLQPYNSSANPEIELDFQIGEHSYHLKKCFGKKGMAELRTANSVFNGSEVEEQLQKLCFTGSNEKSKEVAQSNIWSLLWVDQGTAFYSPEVGELGRKTLEASLESEVGQIAGGNDGQLILRNIKELYQKWYTPTGKEKEKSEYKIAIEKRVELEKKYNECKQKFEQFETLLVDLDRVRSKLSEHTKTNSLPVAEQKLEAALSKRKAIESKRTEFQTAEQIEKTQQGEFVRASETFHARRQVISDLQDAIKRSTENDEKLREIQAQCDEASKMLHLAEQTHSDKKQSHEDACHEHELCERVEAYLRLKQEGELQEIELNKAKQASAALQERRQQMSTINIDRQILNKLRMLDREMLEAKTKLQASATQVEFKPASTASVLLNGNTINPAESLSLTEETCFDLVGWGQVHIRPGGGDLKNIKEAAQNREHALTQALAAAGAKDLHEAEQLEHKKSSLQVEINLLENDITKYASAGIPSKEESCKILASQLIEVARAANFNIDQQADKTAAEALNALRSSRQHRDLAKQALDIADQNLKTATAKFSTIDSQIKTFSATAKALADEQNRLADKLEKDRSKESDAALDFRVTEAKIKLNQAEQTRLALEKSLESENAANIDAEVQRLQIDLETLKREIKALQDSQINLSARLEEQGSNGIAEEIATISGKLEQHQAGEAKLRKTSLAIKLLHDTITESAKQSKAKLTGPLLRHLEPLLSEVFDDGTLALNDASFVINEMRRANINESYEQLSLGTREQLSVLTRLAFAKVLTESQTPALIILDDALVYSDESRLFKMQQTLLRASSELQVIILTCRGRDYAGLNANFIDLADCVAETAMIG